MPGFQAVFGASALPRALITPILGRTMPVTAFALPLRRLGQFQDPEPQHEDQPRHEYDRNPHLSPSDPAVNRQGPQEMNSKGSPVRKSPGSPADEFRWVPGSKIRKGPQQENPKGSPSVISKGSPTLPRERFHRHENKSGDGRVNHSAIRVNTGAGRRR